MVRRIEEKRAMGRKVIEMEKNNLSQALQLINDDTEEKKIKRAQLSKSLLSEWNKQTGDNSKKAQI